MEASPAWNHQTSKGATRKRQARDYTVEWICALSVEFAATEEMLDEEHVAPDNVDDDHHFVYALGRIHDHNIVLTCLPDGSMGTQPAATVAVRMRSKFTRIKFGLMIGIGGGVPGAESDIRLGDVVISRPDQKHGGMIQYDFGKTLTSGHMRTGWLNAPPFVLRAAIAKQRARHLRHQSTLENHLARFSRLEDFSRDSAGNYVLFNADYEHPGGSTCEFCSNVEKVVRPARCGNAVVVHYETIASGNQVMKDGMRRDEIRKELGGVKCFEMQAAGLMNDFPCVVIRGFCDYADSRKNKTWQPYATTTAAACAKEMLTFVPALPEPIMPKSGHTIATGQARVLEKLDILMKELQLGCRRRSHDVEEDLRKDLVDDNVTDVDVEENKDCIDEWIRSAESSGRLDVHVQEQDVLGDDEALVRLHHAYESQYLWEDIPPSNVGSTYYNDISEEEGQDHTWSDHEDLPLPGAEIETEDCAPPRELISTNADVPSSKDGTGPNFSNPDSIFADFLKTSGGVMDDDDDFGKALDHTKAGKCPTDGKASPKLEILVVEKPLAITLEEMFKGVAKKLRVKRKTFDPTTKRESTEERILEVPIKKDLKAESKIKFSGVGDQTERTTQSLHFIIEEKPHALFRRNGDDIHHAVQINVLESLCGWTRPVPTIEGSTRQISTTGVTGPEWKHTFPRLGFANSKKREDRGDFIVEVRIQ